MIQDCWHFKQAHKALRVCTSDRKAVQGMAMT